MPAMPAWDWVRVQKNKSPGEVLMPAMSAWERSRPEGQLPQMVAPAPAMSARDTTHLRPHLSERMRRLLQQAVRPPLTTTVQQALTHGGIPVPAMLARATLLYRYQPFECRSMPRSSDQLIRQAEDHLVEDRARCPCRRGRRRWSTA